MHIDWRSATLKMKITTDYTTGVIFEIILIPNDTVSTHPNCYDDLSQSYLVYFVECEVEVL